MCSDCGHEYHGQDWDYQYLGPEVGEVKIGDPSLCVVCECEGEHA